MVVVNVLHMNAGDGETSYAKNSNFQKDRVLKTGAIVEDTIKAMISSGTIPNCFKLADLGCSSGPNTFLAISKIIDTMHGLCLQMNRECSEFQVFLNDLPDNDFNNIFKSTPSFCEELRKEKADKLGHVFITGLPGSFYGRLFPTKTLHFVYSSNSLHWLSQVPDGLENNKGCIYMSKKSPPSVFTAYKKQFQRDFSIFLCSRAEEIVPGGRMVLEFSGRGSADPTFKDCYYHLQILADLLLDMANEGLLNKDEVDSFNMPYYLAYKEELRMIIQEEGSFNLEKLEVEEIERLTATGSDCKDLKSIAQIVATAGRAVLEPMLTSHFGDVTNSNLFERFGERAAEYIKMEHPKIIIFLISLTKK